ncbi:hypothetical protein THRCLA_08161 [Thraustotheca clavata]|uniref:Uncharacterized protein n=1 Tax=Thraustotheca clavata TaxID=74557 RepID=A0A1V9Z9E6_9STRA|nr:hypothetical protein THRCLA_08161 [Thraustotheca clavata]
MEIQHGNENSPTIRRKLVFQGQSVKQALDVHGALVTNPTKRGTGKRRALGDISNSLATDLSQAFSGLDGKQNVKVSELGKKQAIRVLTDEDIEFAYGGVSKDDDAIYMQGLHEQLDAQADEWKKEVVDMEEKENNSENEAKLDDIQDIANKLLNTDIPTPPESPIEDKSQDLFNTDEYFDFTLVDA